MYYFSTISESESCEGFSNAYWIPQHQWLLASPDTKTLSICAINSYRAEDLVTDSSMVTTSEVKQSYPVHLEWNESSISDAIFTFLPIKIAPKCSLRGAHAKLHQQKPDAAMRNVKFDPQWNSSHKDTAIYCCGCELWGGSSTSVACIALSIKWD